LKQIGIISTLSTGSIGGGGESQSTIITKALKWASMSPAPLINLSLAHLSTPATHMIRRRQVTRERVTVKYKTPAGADMTTP